MFNIAVPAGIGDVSWIWSKLSTIPNESFTIYTPNTWPMRTYDWLKLLPRVFPMIGRHDYNTILLEESRRGYDSYNLSWNDIVKSYEDYEVIYLQPNQHFLLGKPLAEWIPDLGMDFHYKLYISDFDKSVADGLLKERGATGKLLGIHMACLKGAKAWNAWLPENWVEFVKLVRESFPDVQIVLLGGNWDRDMGMELAGLLPNERFIDLIGRTTIGQVISILEKLSYYVGYSSGLNVMCNVLNKSCTALWPDWQQAHIYPHADPEMVDNRKYVGFVYDEPRRIFIRIKSLIKRSLEDDDGGTT